MAQGGVDHVGCVVCKLGRMCAFFFLFFFVMMHYSFSSGTHGKVFTKPSAKIARLNWADVQLLRKWMLFKGGQPVLHTCQCKRTQSASRCLPLSSSLYACVSEAHQSHVRSVPSSKKTPIIQCSVICCSFVYFGLYCMFEPSVGLTLCHSLLLEITIKLLKMIQAVLVSWCGSALREASQTPARSKTRKKGSTVHFSTVGHVNEQVVMIALVSQSYGPRLDTFPRRS